MTETHRGMQPEIYSGRWQMHFPFCRWEQIYQRETACRFKFRKRKMINLFYLYWLHFKCPFKLLLLSNDSMKYEAILFPQETKCSKWCKVLSGSRSAKNIFKSFEKYSLVNEKRKKFQLDKYGDRTPTVYTDRLISASKGCCYLSSYKNGLWTKF